MLKMEGRSWNKVALCFEYHSSPSSRLRLIIYCGISCRSVLIHEGSPREIYSSDPFNFLLFSRSWRYSTSLVSFYFRAFSILASRIGRSASLFLDLGRRSRGFSLAGLRSQIQGTPAILNSLRICAWQRLLMASSSRSAPGMTRLNALVMFLTQNSLVQVI